MEDRIKFLALGGLDQPGQQRGEIYPGRRDDRHRFEAPGEYGFAVGGG